ncbi:hypothetical protein GCM10011376_24920 [Nocardioides flavus (ex Wang et al. 2016)]|uniref:Secreted protein n=1 Tax=Nocardioides flavus (ex Wang et al. 2016) TaxID=2058780 RepID=A0ABQ3HN79_9ACTN|nr:hypothetical protein [Nocardioides flavus (ex Wang et al. 2016)]GHE17882.1 hypothetical protein GCM10011376_24920 [Nocardioides flavus (ex Wang et al. 2016)]
MSTASESPYVRGVHLERTDENVREIDALAGLLGEPAGLAGLLTDLKWELRRSRVPRLLGRAVREAYRWDAHDERDEQWYPQGISTSADSSETGDVDGRRVVVTTWYSTGRDGTKRGSRVTFVDLDSGTYRHVLLVSPVLDETGALTLRPTTIHAGGVVWAGPYLHIAATSRGFVTARVDDIMRVPGDDDHPDRFGLDGTRVHSYGHRYVLPVRFTYRAHAEDGHQKLRYSFMSLDRGSDPPALVAGEYALDPDATTRLARYELDPHTWQIPAGEDGYSRPLAIDHGGVRQMQGAVIAGGRYHVTVSHGPWMPGSMYAGRPGAMRGRRWALPMGPEDLSYWPSTDRLWSLTEHPRRRWIVAMDRAWFD